MIQILPETAIVAAILIAFSLYSISRKLLDWQGLLLALVVGILAYSRGGKTAFVVLVLVYAIAQLATKVSKLKGNVHSQRGFGNIFGNAVPAVAWLLAGNLAAFFGASASALADTVASEFGILSKTKPVMITTGKTVPGGTDGGVTALGFAAAICASLFLGAVYYFFAASSLKVAVLVAVAGLFGTVVDSILGALFQSKGMLDNNQVNFFANLLAGLLVFALLSI